MTWGDCRYLPDFRETHNKHLDEDGICELCAALLTKMGARIAAGTLSRRPRSRCRAVPPSLSSLDRRIHSPTAPPVANGSTALRIRRRASESTGNGEWCTAGGAGSC